MKYLRLLSALGALFYCSVAFAAGTIPFSLSQQLDQYGHPLSGGLIYFIQAGTTSTPQNAYQDSALTIPLPNPITLDASGRIPQLFLADGTIKVRLTDKNGVTQVVADNIQVIGASSGSGGGGTVDPTTVLSTGDMKITYGTGSLTGFVRANGRTIGSSTSGATERANADTQALFEYLWGTDSSLAVSGGRGASASADWAANKTIALPDWRGRAIAGLDDMGNSAAGRLTASYFGTAATVLGAAGGTESQTLTQAQLPAFKPGITITDPGHHHTYQGYQSTATAGPGSSFIAVNAGTGIGTFFSSSELTGITASFTSNLGSGNAHPIVSPMMLATIYLKL